MSPRAGHCALVHHQNCSGMAQETLQTAECMTWSPIPQIPVWSSIHGTWWNKSDPWRLHCGLDQALTHWGLHTSEGVLWCLAVLVTDPLSPVGCELGCLWIDLVPALPVDALKFLYCYHEINRHQTQVIWDKSQAGLKSFFLWQVKSSP